MKTQLFEIQFRVHLTPDHPKYYEYQFGLLIIWLYAKDHQAAAKEAIAWATPLPYELGKAKCFSIADQTEFLPHQINCIPRAESMGRNLAFLHWPMGSDEDEILGNWPGIVPLINLPEIG